MNEIKRWLHIDILRDFKKKLSKKMPIDKMILFGSRARGRARRWSDFSRTESSANLKNFDNSSDVDLFIVSKKFRRVNSLRRSRGFYNYWNANYPVDFLCYGQNQKFCHTAEIHDFCSYTPSEFKKMKKGVTIVRDAVKNGIEI